MNSLKVSSELSEIDVLNLPTIPEEYLHLDFKAADVDTQCQLTLSDDSEYTIQNGYPFPFANGNVCFPKVINCIPLTKGNDVKDIFDISLDFSDCDIKFQPGDTIGVVPSNCVNEVNCILNVLKVTDICDLKYILTIKQGNLKKKAVIPPYIPISSTVRYIFESCLDIRTIPKKLFLRALCEYTKDPLEKRRLQELCSKEGAKEYSQFIVEAGVNFIDLLNAFPSCCPPVERVIEFLPRLQARPYSLASSPLAGPLVHLVFSLIKFSAPPFAEDKFGLCTKWLYSISKKKQQIETFPEEFATLSLENTSLANINKRIPVYLRKRNEFCLPNNLAIPLILIGPGTGIAPFIAFLQHRKFELEMSNMEMSSVGDIWLFSGCRYADRDFIFETEINDFVKRKIVTRFFMAFSREKKDGYVKYVQDNIKVHSTEFAKQLLDKKSTLFVCGDAKNMAKDVWETIATVLHMEKNISKEEAYELLNSLKKEKRYIQDIWI